MAKKLYGVLVLLLRGSVRPNRNAGGSVKQLSSVSESNGRSAIGLTPHVNPPIRRAEDVGLTSLFIGFMVRLALKEKPASLNLLLKNSVAYYDAQEGSRHSDAAVLPSSNRRLL